MSATIAEHSAPDQAEQPVCGVTRLIVPAAGTGRRPYRMRCIAQRHPGDPDRHYYVRAGGAS